MMQEEDPLSLVHQIQKIQILLQQTDINDPNQNSRDRGVDSEELSTRLQKELLQLDQRIVLPLATPKDLMAVLAPCLFQPSHGTCSTTVDETTNTVSTAMTLNTSVTASSITAVTALWIMTQLVQFQSHVYLLPAAEMIFQTVSCAVEQQEKRRQQQGENQSCCLEWKPREEVWVVSDELLQAILNSLKSSSIAVAEYAIQTLLALTQYDELVEKFHTFTSSSSSISTSSTLATTCCWKERLLQALHQSFRNISPTSSFSSTLVLRHVSTLVRLLLMDLKLQMQAPFPHFSSFSSSSSSSSPSSPSPSSILYFAIKYHLFQDMILHLLFPTNHNTNIILDTHTDILARFTLLDLFLQVVSAMSCFFSFFSYTWLHEPGEEEQEDAQEKQVLPTQLEKTEYSTFLHWSCSDSVLVPFFSFLGITMRYPTMDTFSSSSFSSSFSSFDNSLFRYRPNKNKYMIQTIPSISILGSLPKECPTQKEKTVQHDSTQYMEGMAEEKGIVLRILSNLFSISFQSYSWDSQTLEEPCQTHDKQEEEDTEKEQEHKDLCRHTTFSTLLFQRLVLWNYFHIAMENFVSLLFQKDKNNSIASNFESNYLAWMDSICIYMTTSTDIFSSFVDTFHSSYDPLFDLERNLHPEKKEVSDSSLTAKPTTIDPYPRWIQLVSHAWLDLHYTAAKPQLKSAVLFSIASVLNPNRRYNFSVLDQEPSLSLSSSSSFVMEMNRTNKKNTTTLSWNSRWLLLQCFGKINQCSDILFFLVMLALQSPFLEVRMGALEVLHVIVVDPFGMQQTLRSCKEGASKLLEFLQMNSSNAARTNTTVKEEKEKKFEVLKAFVSNPQSKLIVSGATYKNLELILSLGPFYVRTLPWESMTE